MWQLSLAQAGGVAQVGRGSWGWLRKQGLGFGACWRRGRQLGPQLPGRGSWGWVGTDAGLGGDTKAGTERKTGASGELFRSGETGPGDGRVGVDDQQRWVQLPQKTVLRWQVESGKNWCSLQHIPDSFSHVWTDDCARRWLEMSRHVFIAD